MSERNEQRKSVSSGARFTRDDKRRIEQTPANVALAISKLGVSLSYDVFARHELIHGLDGYGPRFGDDASNHLRIRIGEQFRFRVQKQWFEDLVSDFARRRRFHPVREYFDSLSWDRQPRIDRWLVDCAGARDTRYVRAVSRLVLVAAARRIRRPGAKFDEMLILESPQGCDKSQALRALAGNEDWFTDDLPLGSDTRRFMESTAGKWIVEAGELRGMSRADVAALKQCLSRQRDESRMAYGHRNTFVPREFVIIGTTNETSNYLRDRTGNRRFWPVRIQRFNLERLRADRDQLWAEAAAAEEAGESIRLDPELYEDAAIEQQARMRDEGPLIDVLYRALGDRTGKIRVSDAYLVCGIDPGKATQDQRDQLGSAIRELGFQRMQKRFDGKVEYAYARGTEAEQRVEIVVELDPVSRAATIGG